eukprot:8807530-Alexandrium_andersonii.AAC.1
MSEVEARRLGGRHQVDSNHQDRHCKRIRHLHARGPSLASSTQGFGPSQIPSGSPQVVVSRLVVQEH